MNQKPKEMLILYPPYELHFVGPFIVPRTTVLKLKNPTDQTMLFKIKTTAPKRYCVRPNFGAIPPYESSTVEICLQPFNYDPNEKNKHKFMVQSMVAPSGENIETKDQNSLWKEAEQMGLLMDCKLRCVFEMPPDSGSVNDKSVLGPSQMDTVKTNQSPRPVESATEKVEVSHEPASKDYLENEIVAQLIEENTCLKKSNTQLKDQITQLMLSPKEKGNLSSPYTPQIVEKQIPMLYLAIAFAAAILGLLLGKFLL